MKRSFYADTISNFCSAPSETILGILASNNEFSLELTQREAWLQQIDILKNILPYYNGSIFFEYSIPRMGKRIDVVLIIQNVIFVLEFKIGEKEFLLSASDQVLDYSLDLKNFHETSHEHLIAPILIATAAKDNLPIIVATPQNDNLLFTIKTNVSLLDDAIRNVLLFADGELINTDTWIAGRYSPTPTIIEAAMALYNGHAVEEISRNDAEAENLSKTSKAVSAIIFNARNNNEKVICFVTGVPGAGKTLVGLDIATKHFEKGNDLTSVFLSGNGPLVAVLREALTRDKFKREKEQGKKVRKNEIMSEVKLFIQNVHNFRDECLRDAQPPFEHVAIFDEAQRAWNHLQTANFMQRKKNTPNFNYSEPEFLISCLDRHQDWAVVICLVGGGQEINTGEAGISEWIQSLNRSFPDWHVYISDRLTDSEYAAGKALQLLEKHESVITNPALHLSVSLRSFRAEHLSLFIKNLLDLNMEEAKKNYQAVKDKYPVVLTRDIAAAKYWLKQQARGSERYGIVASSQAQRLKPFAIDVRSPMDPIHWFLDGKEDVRSSYYLEDVATEFHVQGLELDWACVTWDADFRYTKNGWQYYSFVGDRWNNIKKEERKQYLKNAYRVLLTRARQGMVIVVPQGDDEDATRKNDFYDETFKYLRNVGCAIVS
jgi:schlafen family protein